MRRIGWLAGVCLTILASSVGVVVAAPPAVAATVPTAPGVATAVASDGAAIVSWGPPVSDGGSPISGYAVTPYRGQLAEPTQTFMSTARTQTLVGLSNGSAYGFRVAAINAEGTGPASGLNQFNSLIVGAPRAPTDVTAIPGPQSVRIFWTPPEDNGSPVTSYSIEITDPASPSLFPPSVPIFRATDRATVAIPADQTRIFRVRAINDRGMGVGGSSNAVTALPAPPSAPGQVTATAGIESASVTWTPPSSDGGRPIQGYVLTPSRDGVPLEPITLPPTSSSQSFSGLTPGAYRYVVAAFNAAGTGSPSSPSNPVQVATTTMPGPPGSARAVPGDGSAVVSWGSPSSNGGSPVTGYVVTPYNGTVAEPAQTFQSTARTQTLTGLANGQQYRFRVSAVNANGIGLQSPVSGPFAGVVVGSPLAPVSSAVAGERSAEVSWTPSADNGAPIDRFRLAIATPTQSGLASRIVEVAGDVDSVSVGGLEPCVPHTISVSARNSRGYGPSLAAAPVIPTTNVAGPSANIVAYEGVESASVWWWSPDDTGGVPIVGYDVTPYRDGVALPTISTSTPEQAYTFDELAAGVYTFTVAARTCMGVGVESAPSGPIAVPAAGTPSSPGVAAATPGNGSAVVSWLAPPSDGGSPIIGYVVVPFNGDVAEAPQTFMSTARTQTLTGLANGGYYRFRVAAINAVGFGQVSALPNPFFGVTVGSPLAPTALVATAGVGQVALSWGPPPSDNGSPVTSYNVRVTRTRESLINARTVVVGGGATSTTIDALSSGVAYTFHVNAVNARGIGRPASRGPVTPT